MDWIRRNWPDLLIGIALLAVIAGIIATLLSGGSFLPFARNSSPAISTSSSATPTTSSTSLPPASTENSTGSSNAVQDATNAVNAAVDNAVDAANQTTSNAADASSEVAQDVANAVETVVQPIIPDLPSVDSSANPDAAAEASAETSTAVEGTAETTTATSSTSTALSASVADSPTAPYRVSVGAFGSAENAERRAATFRDAGYPVFLGRQGNLNIVLVGPYNTEAEAEQVRNQISSSGLEPNPAVYRYDPSTVVEDVSSATTSAETTVAPTTTPETPSASTTTQTTTTTPAASTASAPPTASAGRYLQVGAYNSIEGSMPQRIRLEAMGYTVVHIDEAGLIKLLVGPFDANNLGVAQSQLNSQGIESFVR